MSTHSRAVRFRRGGGGLGGSCHLLELVTQVGHLRRELLFMAAPQHVQRALPLDLGRARERGDLGILLGGDRLAHRLHGRLALVLSLHAKGRELRRKSLLRREPRVGQLGVALHVRRVANRCGILLLLKFHIPPRL